MPLLDWPSGTIVQLPLGRHWRYFSAFRCEKAKVCLLFKDQVTEKYVGLLTSHDGVHFDSGIHRLLNSSWKRAHMTHNLAIAGPHSLAGSSRAFLLVGGQYNTDRTRRGERPNEGIWFARWPIVATATSSAGSSSNVALSSHSTATAAATAPLFGARPRLLGARLLFNGSHPNCIERRRGLNNKNLYPGVGQKNRACEFDGRLSLVHHKGRWLLFARANPTERGNRYVQVTQSSDGLRTWSPFKMLEMRDYRFTDGDMYFFLVFNNPVNARSLVAIFPLLQYGVGGSCIGIAASSDGIRWSPIAPLASCPYADPRKERALCHPAGLVPSEAGNRDILLYLHNSVPAPDKYGGKSQRPDLIQPIPTLTLHRISRQAFSSWSSRALATAG